MSFKALDAKLLEVLPDHPKNGEKVDDSFRWAYLHTLREVNGNLDTVALCSRAHVEIVEQIKIQNQAVLVCLDRLATSLEAIAGALSERLPRYQGPRRRRRTNREGGE